MPQRFVASRSSHSLGLVLVDLGYAPQVCNLKFRSALFWDHCYCLLSPEEFLFSISQPSECFKWIFVDPFPRQSVLSYSTEVFDNDEKYYALFCSIFPQQF